MRLHTIGTANPEERADGGHTGDTEIGVRLRGGGDNSSGEEFEFTKRMPVCARRMRTRLRYEKMSGQGGGDEARHESHTQGYLSPIARS